MKTKRKSIFLILVLLVFMVLSCSKKSNEEIFSEKLKNIDMYITEGKQGKALRQLSSLTKKAKTSTNYISIVKRQLKLNAATEAIITLQKGVKSMPDAKEISAVLISVLIENGRSFEALPYCTNVENSIYAGLGAEASIRSDTAVGALNSGFSLLKTAFDNSGEQIFLKNAALVLAREGKLQEAAALRNSLGEEIAPDDPFFWSCLSYDLGLFDPVFSDLYFTLVYADRDSGVEKNIDFARRHLLLAADAAYGQGDMERARAFWQAAADRSPERSPIVFYDLALTAPDDKERVDLLIECIEHYPGYYPVIARYVREFIAMREKGNKDEITDYLEKRGFYSMQMEKMYFTSPKMTYTPEELLSRAMKEDNFDPRFILEDFRYRQFKEGVRERGKAEMWKILEKYGTHSEIREYAKWYFSTFRDFDACFGIAKLNSSVDNAFYDALASCITGKLKNAEKDFELSAHNIKNAYAAEANEAYIFYLQGKIDMAIDTFVNAASMTRDKKKQSRLAYEAASILAEKKAYDRAIGLLTYSLELNPQNYPAAVLLKRLNGAK